MLHIRDVVEATGGEAVSGGAASFSGVSIDSRTIQEGDLFIALKGERFDGHDFAAEALKRCGGIMVDRNALCVMSGGLAVKGLRIADCDTGKAVIAVDDTLRALQDLARSIRKKFTGPVIGVIGSNGKTTTKELISSIIGTKLKVLKTAGNLNNHIGMPLSVARADADTGAMVLELGTNRPGDIRELCTIASPDIGVITNIGYEHLQGFGSIEGVRDSELELLPYVKQVVLNADDRFLMEGVKGCPPQAERRAEGKKQKKGGRKRDLKNEITTFGMETGSADVTAREVIFTDEGVHYSLCAGSKCIPVNSPLSGRFNIYNSLAAAAAAYAMGFNLQEIKRGLESFTGVSMRFEIIKEGGVTYLNDSYNANPSSMEESLKELARRVQSPAEGGPLVRRAVAVLGDMLELGDYGVEAHRNVGRMLSGLQVGIFIGVGPLMGHAVSEFRGKGIHTGTSEDAARELGRIVREGDIVLIKGSRGMRMEKVLSAARESEPPGSGNSARG